MTIRTCCDVYSRAYHSPSRFPVLQVWEWRMKRARWESAIERPGIDSVAACQLVDLLHHRLLKMVKFFSIHFLHHPITKFNEQKISSILFFWRHFLIDSVFSYTGFQAWKVMSCTSAWQSCPVTVTSRHYRNLSIRTCQVRLLARDPDIPYGLWFKLVAINLLKHVLLLYQILTTAFL